MDEVLWQTIGRAVLGFWVIQSIVGKQQEEKGVYANSCSFFYFDMSSKASRRLFTNVPTDATEFFCC